VCFDGAVGARFSCDCWSPVDDHSKGPSSSKVVSKKLFWLVSEESESEPLTTRFHEETAWAGGRQRNERVLPYRRALFTRIRRLHAARCTRATRRVSECVRAGETRGKVNLHTKKREKKTNQIAAGGACEGGGRVKCKEVEEEADDDQGAPSHAVRVSCRLQ
jgi:hypothetical protein